MHTLKFILIIFATFVVAFPSYARYQQTAKIRYNVQYGMSKWYEVDVTFMTGSELNAATGTFKYGYLDNYAVVFWSEDQVSIIKFKNFSVCGFEFEKSCLPIFKIKGLDQQGRQWEVCTDSYCF